MTATDCQFAIRGGGHTPWKGSANIDNGVTVDLSSMKSVNVNRSNTTVSVGPGARWSDVYEKLDAIGLGVGGGRISDVGVAGLITGGGLSHFAARDGFVCDQVLNFEVALASGRIVNANATSNPDLWFALKGGSSNFGIVTRFDLKAFPQGKAFGGIIVNPINTLPEQIQAFAEFNNATNYDTNAAYWNSYAYNNRDGWFISNTLFYSKPEVHPAVLRPLLDIKPQVYNTMRLSNLSDITKELALVLTIANTTLQSFAHTPNLTYAVTYQPLPPAITSRSANSGGNPLGLDPASGPQVLVLQSIEWSNAADDNLINTAARELWQQADELALKMGLKRDWIYLNYAAEDQDPIGSYGEENVRRLREASRKFDPTGLFQTSVPGGFKLWEKRGVKTA
ncbi:MAG: hypothetical protein Q9196_004482 [Gyalolechia fulgens]